MVQLQPCPHMCMHPLFMCPPQERIWQDLTWQLCNAQVSRRARRSLWPVTCVHRTSRPSVTSLPLIDTKREAASPVPVAKLRRHLITSASGARAMAAPAVDVKSSSQTPSRPATAAATKPVSGKYAKSRLYGSSAFSLVAPRKAAASPRPEIFTHELSDAYMKRTMKQALAHTARNL